VNQPLRIVQMIDSIKVGGAEKLLVNFAAEAQAHDLPLAVIGLKQIPASPVEAELRSLQAQVVYFTGQGLLSPGRILRIARFLRQGQFDILHTHLTYANIIGVLAGRLAGLPVIGTLHSVSQEARHYHAGRQRLEAWGLRLGARRVIAVGHSVAQAHQPRLGNKPITVIPNAVPAPAALSAAERLALRQSITGNAAGNAERPLMIAVGRLSIPKGYADLLDALAVVRSACPGVALVIAGDGPLRTDLQAQAEALGLGSSVILLGARTDVPALLAASDLFVSASHWEGLPLALLEAMMAGLPCVVTSVGENPLVLSPGTGRLVPPHQPDQLAAAVIDLLHDPEQRARLGQAARQHAEAHYHTRPWFERLLSLYQECL